uniref:Uncharacterized protein n=1 Tax=Arundo donax TaxID=35708 RepID=A0A0A9GBJ0_ARUDO
MRGGACARRGRAAVGAVLAPAVRRARQGRGGAGSGRWVRSCYNGKL